MLIDEDDFRRWLDTKSGPYDYKDLNGCALWQYLEHAYPGEKHTVGSETYSVRGLGDVDIPSPLNRFLYDAKTFERLRAMLDNPEAYPPDELISWSA